MFLMTRAKMILIIIIESVSRKALQRRMAARQNGAQTSTSHFVEIKSSGRFGKHKSISSIAIAVPCHYKTLLEEVNWSKKSATPVLATSTTLY